MSQEGIVISSAGGLTRINDAFVQTAVTGHPGGASPRAINFGAFQLQTITVEVDMTFTTAELTDPLGAGLRSVSLKILCDATPRLLTFPASWIWVSPMPSGIAAGKTAILTLTAYGATDAGVVAAYAVEA